MSHKEIREKLPLLLYNELTEIERVSVEQHMEQCVDCRNELAEIRKLHGSLADKPVTPTEELLQAARHQLRGALRLERSRHQELPGRRLILWRPLFQYALGAVATLAVGVFVGYLAFGSRIQEHHRATGPGDGSGPMQNGDLQIANIKFIDADATDGQVEFEFDTVTPMRLKGSINHPQVQKVLSYAMVNEQNPGLRLRAVNAFQTQQFAPDAETKTALITTLKTDENPGVRMQAMAVLQKYPMDVPIKQTMLYVLQHDSVAGLRVEAIKSLQPGHLKDQDVLKVLRKQAASEENDYIRLTAIQALKEEGVQQ